ncbi:MAG: enoyl-CoA hydratase/isomerase family protein [Proteobacteria bacterium]|nr:enoyl-CoA hydratase/isomerase family protein [Pseudomonadota bacterium]
MTQAPDHYTHVKISQSGPIATIALSRPERANALSYDHLAELEQAALSFREFADVRVVIITGAGKHFSSGADLQDSAAPADAPLVQRRRHVRMGQRAIQAILSMDQITIAAWRGAAMGGGACVATACDFRVGSHSAFMQYPEVDLGINLMWKSLPLILALVGPARAKRLVAGAERVSAKTLYDWGVLDYLTADAALMDKAQEMAEEYATKPPIAAQMIKQSANHLAYALGNSIMHMDSDQYLLSATSDDRSAAIAAKLNQREPDFTGN